MTDVSSSIQSVGQSDESGPPPPTAPPALGRLVVGDRRGLALPHRRDLPAVDNTVADAVCARMESRGTGWQRQESDRRRGRGRVNGRRFTAQRFRRCGCQWVARSPQTSSRRASRPHLNR